MSDVSRTSPGEASTYEPGDEVAGGWSFEALHLMTERFVARVRRAIAEGLEAPPQAAFEGPVRAYTPAPTAGRRSRPTVATKNIAATAVINWLIASAAMPRQSMIRD